EIGPRFAARREHDVDPTAKPEGEIDRGLVPATSARDLEPADRSVADRDVDEERLPSRDRAHRDPRGTARELQTRGLALVGQDLAAGVEEIAARIAGIGEDAEVHEAHAGVREHVAVRALADEVRDIDLVEDALAGAEGARPAGAIERGPAR